jgi:hypothetical protein
MNKKCTKCGLEKPTEDFYSERKKLKLVISNVCRSCYNEKKRLQRENKKDILNGKAREKYANMSEEEKKEHIKKKVEGNKRINNIDIKRKLYGLSDKGIYSRYKNDSNRRNRHYVFALSFEEFSKLINDSCYYCGNFNCRGIDRLDNSIGYILENCVPCCEHCNIMKNKYSIEEFIEQIKKILEHLKV